MSHPAPADVPAERPARGRRSAVSGHRAAPGELAALAFLVPLPREPQPVGVRPTPVPLPRPAID